MGGGGSAEISSPHGAMNLYSNFFPPRILPCRSVSPTSEIFFSLSREYFFSFFSSYAHPAILARHAHVFCGWFPL